jgi:hypothetical protein
MRRADAPLWWRRTNNNDEWFYVLHLGFTPPKNKPAEGRLLFDLPWRGGGDETMVLRSCFCRDGD